MNTLCRLTLIAIVAAVAVRLAAASAKDDTNCMVQLLVSYGVQAAKAQVYAKNMAEFGIDERDLGHHGRITVALLRLQLRRSGVSEGDLKKIITCVSGGVAADKACSQRPCTNGGECAFHNQSTKLYICDCPPGFGGQHCETDSCSPNPCGSFGKCYHSWHPHRFRCVCVDGYTGRMCNQTVDECLSLPCLNGGTCEDKVRGYNCSCPLGFKGTHCETEWLSVAAFEKLSSKVKYFETKLQRLEEDQCQVAHGVVNWHHKTWILNSDADSGQLATTSFKKLRSDTYLRLTWGSSIREHTVGRCSEWYFTIDDHGCTNPGPVNGRVYQASGGSNNVVRQSTIVGVCRGTSAGVLGPATYKIGINVRSCPGYSGNNAYTGWASTSAMIVEELCPPQ